jgi:hypothetical protein
VGPQFPKILWWFMICWPQDKWDPRWRVITEKK